MSKEAQHWKTHEALLKCIWGEHFGSYHQGLCPRDELAVSKPDRTADPTCFSSPIIHFIIVLVCTDLADQASMGTLFSKPERISSEPLLVLLYQDLTISKLIKSQRFLSVWKAKFTQNNYLRALKQMHCWEWNWIQETKWVKKNFFKRIL